MVWTMIKRLGEGGQGFVSLARSWPTPEDDHITVALNLPPLVAVKSALFSDSQPLQFKREILGALNYCPNIIRCYGADASLDEEGEVLYHIFLEYAAGGSLADRIYSSQPFGEEEVREYTRSVLQGLKQMHSEGMIHCDIKPDNILLVVDDSTGGYIAKIGDLGLAIQDDETVLPKVRGTLPYVAPESILYRHYGPGVDIWALGCTVVEMLTRKPLRGYNLRWDEVFEMAKQQVDIPRGISKDARDFLTKCLNLDPASRWSAGRLLKEHPFVCDADLEADNREATVLLDPSDEWDVSSDVDEEELLHLITPVKLLKRYREEEGLSDDLYTGSCKKPKLDPYHGLQKGV